MASVKKYQTSAGSRWRVQYRSPDGKNRTKQPFETKRAALDWAAENTTAISSGAWIDPAGEKITVDVFGERWLGGLAHLKPSSARVMRLGWSTHVQPEWGSRKAGSIRPSEVASWVASMDRSPTTVRRAHSVLSQVLELAVMDGNLRSNPARGVKLPKKSAAAPVFLTADQLARIAGECSRHGELVWLLGTAGLRWGEAAALRVRDVDFLRRRISVERNAVTVGNEVVIGTPKTHEKRTVAVTAKVADMLAPLCAGKSREALLWSREGEPLKLPSAGSWYFEALARVQAADPEFPRVTPHGLRHVAAGLMVSAGANVKVVQKQLGHASAAMTLDTYAALFDEDLDDVAEALDVVVASVV